MEAESVGEVEVTLWTHRQFIAGPLRRNQLLIRCIQFNLPHIHVFGRWEEVKSTPQRTHADEGMNMQTPQRTAQARLRTLDLLAVRRRCRPLHHLTENNLCLYVFKPSVGTRRASEDSWLPAGWEEGSALCLHLQTCGQMLSWREEDRFRSDWTKAVVAVVT